MHPFLETISIAGAIGTVIVAAIVVLTLFFRGWSWISGAGSELNTVAIQGVLKKDTLATVHLVDGKTVQNVQFVGFTSSAAATKTCLPYELQGMVIFEDRQKQRYLVRARDIRMIVVAPDSQSG